MCSIRNHLANHNLLALKYTERIITQKSFLAWKVRRSCASEGKDPSRINLGKVPLLLVERLRLGGNR